MCCYQNETEYRAWRLGHNGIKRERRREQAAIDSGESFGYFGAVNLLGPRSATQNPPDMRWHNAFTFTQLRVEFLDGTSGGPATINRTFFTFYDFDTGLAQVAPLQTPNLSDLDHTRRVRVRGERVCL